MAPTLRRADGAHGWRLRSYHDFEFEFRRDKAADAVAGRPLLPPVRIADCATCGWRAGCNADLEAGTGDPSLIPRVRYRQWRTLKDAGITTRADVASLDYPTAVLATTVDLTRWYADAVNADPNSADRQPPSTRTHPNPGDPRRRHFDCRRAPRSYPLPHIRIQRSRLLAPSNPERPCGTGPRTPLPPARRRPAGSTSSRHRDRGRHGKRSRRCVPVGRPGHQPDRNRSCRHRLPGCCHLGSAHDGHRLRELPPLLGLARHNHYHLHPSWRLDARL